MNEKYKTINRINSNDIKLAQEMLSKGYKLIQIVPRYFLDGLCCGYTYWFESKFESIEDLDNR